MSRIATFPLVALLAVLLLASCARKEPEVDFKPIQLSWSALTPEAESHPSKDACVIQITAKLMQEKRVVGSSIESLDYSVMYKIEGENLEFEGICENLELRDIPECQWTVVCSDPENVVVKFHNGD